MSEARGARCAFVTGGSSGIGLAAALRLARGHGRLGLFARDPAGLAQAAELIRRAVPGTVVGCYPVDMADAEAVTEAVALAVAALGPPQRVVLAAGTVALGETVGIDAELHHRVMEVNYFGVLWAVRAVLPHMQAGAVIGLVGSAGGVVGIYGYAAYAPSKFALRGLADILRVELAARGIGVTLCLPPDTETPMLWREERERSAVTARMAAGGKRMTAEAVAAALVSGMDRGRFLVLPNLPVRLLWWLAPVLLPWMQRRQIRLLRAAGSSHVFADDMDEHGQDAPGKEAHCKDQRQA